MTKERFIEVTKMPEVPMDVWFEYYKDRGGVLDFEEFKKVFTTFLWNESIVTVRGVQKHITLRSALNNFYQYYKTKFNLWQVET
jgi:hypothetical protein